MKKRENKPRIDVLLPTGKYNLSKENISTIVGDNHIVVLSPHLDDAVLSMGSLISHLLKNSIKVTVISIFTRGSDLISESIQTIMKRASFVDVEQYFKQRKIEDIIALTELGEGVEIKHLDLVDAAWRSKNNVPLYPTTQLADVHAVDENIYAKLQIIMEDIRDTTPDIVVFAPLARGRHVDHTLTRDAALSTFPEAILYEDFPYSALYRNERGYIQSNDLIGLKWGGDYLIKKSAILKYQTQAVSLFARGTMVLPYEKYYIKPR